MMKSTVVAFLAGLICFAVGVTGDTAPPDDAGGSELTAASRPLRLGGRGELSCRTSGADDWNTWAHDYNRTSATHVALGDPLRVELAWVQDLPEYNSFCEPTVANDIVYVASDYDLSIYRLTEGTSIQSINILCGSPQYCALLYRTRTNTTIENGKAYVACGLGNSIACTNANLLPLAWADWVTTTPVYGTLGDWARFGVTSLCSIAGTEIVFVGTENSVGAGGRLWALNASNGWRFSGWATNPLFLDEGIIHSPAFDGDDLYIGTAGESLTNGSIYRIDAATGEIIWRFKSELGPEDGYPGGVSLEGDFVYAASRNPDGNGHRVKLNKSDGSVVWEYPQARSLYAAPAIGRNYLYIPQDAEGTAVLAVNKTTGEIVHDWAKDGVGRVTQHVTLTCDNYLFAGDRNGRWWLLNARDFSAEWFVQFNGIVNGTAVATDDLGNDYAVVSIRSGNATNGGGYIAAYQLDKIVDESVRQHLTSAAVRDSRRLTPWPPPMIDDVVPVVAGDADGDGFVTARDLAIMIDLVYLGRSGATETASLAGRGDLDCDGHATTADITHLADYLFHGVPQPAALCE